MGNKELGCQGDHGPSWVCPSHLPSSSLEIRFPCVKGDNEEPADTVRLSLTDVWQILPLESHHVQAGMLPVTPVLIQETGDACQSLGMHLQTPSLALPVFLT